jgi:excisionase family DNA binding protein
MVQQTFDLDRVERILKEAASVPQRFLTIPQASRYAGISQKSIRRLIDSGKLKSHRPTTRILIDRLALDSMIQSS